MRHGVPLAMSLWLSSVAAVSRAQEPPKPPSSAEEQTVEATEPVEPQEEATGPAQGAPTVTLAEAVRIALERNYGMLGAADALLASRYRESAARAQFYPRLTPRFQRGGGNDRI